MMMMKATNQSMALSIGLVILPLDRVQDFFLGYLEALVSHIKGAAQPSKAC